MNLATGHRLFQVRHRQRAEDFQAFLHQVHRQYRGWRVTLLLDSDRSHTAIASQTGTVKEISSTCLDPQRVRDLLNRLENDVY
jgi:hypothetical protein